MKIYAHKHSVSVLQNHNFIPSKPKLLAGTANLPSCTAFLFCFFSFLGAGCGQVCGSAVCQLHLLLVMGAAMGFGRRFPDGTHGRSRQGFTASVCFQGSYGVTPYSALQAIDTSCHLCYDFCYSLKKEKKKK